MDRLIDSCISAVFSKALENESLLKPEDTAVVFYDLSFIDQRIRDLRALFPPTALHAIAVKANPLVTVLKKVAAAGVGFEVATLPEIYLALNGGAAPEKIVFDSPAKTTEELKLALALGVHINADSLAELARIETLLQTQNLEGTIGIRINPQVGLGNILSTSVAGHYSKFGVPLEEQQSELIDAFVKYEWLSGVHLHIGSQGCDLQLLLKGVEKVVRFVEKVNRVLQAQAKPRRVRIVDLGGGLPVSYNHDVQPATMKAYATELGTRFPAIFNPEIRIFTEFGRYIFANSGWVVSRVEYVKKSSTLKTAVIHVGADLFLRECYNPSDWYHEIIVVDCSGKIKRSMGAARYMIAGPLCFAGDIVGRELMLPEIEAGDYVIIKDTGAYTLSMWSRYNSRQIPKTVGYYQDGEKFEILKEREKIEDILRFWT